MVWLPSSNSQRVVLYSRNVLEEGPPF
ncbi:hypothetical protein F383_37871 [Gossypium arboreum]|uniref:Uncharacterized protein n=1 Tax=Gossypium arboreum TaxID=29729 RepID=A0A0B0MID4_GOSAR|nr:hypothetical protein F383_37871 [Gossypium arboreum]